MPELASDSQKFYGYKPTVGIEGAQERVIQLLDLNEQNAKSIVVVVHGLGGIGKTTLADAVYANLNLQSYKDCRIQMDQGCTIDHLKVLQQQILNGLFNKNIELKNCAEGQGRLWSFFQENPHQPLFLYIDNGLKSTDLERLLPKGLDNCLPPKSRILITTRNLDETAMFAGRNIERRLYNVSPLPDAEAKKLLLEKVPEYNDKVNIEKLLKLCGGVPLLLELAGSQLGINKEDTRNIVLEMVNEGKEVKERDIIEDMVDFVYDRLPSPVQEAFLDITFFFYNWSSKYLSSIVGEAEFRRLEAASFVKTSKEGKVIVHDIVKARGRRLGEQEGNRIRDVNTLSECLEVDEKLKKLRGIYFDFYGGHEQPAIEINSHHLNCMSGSLRVLCYNKAQMTFKEKCEKPFEQLRCLKIVGYVCDLPIEFEKLEHLVYYAGPFTQSMNLYEFPPSLRFMFLRDYSQKRVEYSKIPPEVTPGSSLVTLSLDNFKNMERLPDGVEKLPKLERLTLSNCDRLRELPSKLADISNLRELSLDECHNLKELPSNFEQLSNLTTLDIKRCYALSALPSNFGQLKNLKELIVSACVEFSELPSDFGQLENLEKLDLSACFGLTELPSDFGQLKSLKTLLLDWTPHIKEWPLSFGELTRLTEINLTGCSGSLQDSLPENIRQNIRF